MMLAAVGSDAYNVVLVLHILSAIVGLGGVFLANFYYQQARSRGGTEGLAIVEAYRVVGKVATFFMVAVLVLGIALVLMSDDAWSFGDTWIVLALAVYAVAMVVGGAILDPLEQRALDLQRAIVTAGPSAAGDEAAELVKLDRRMTYLGGLLNGAVLLILVFMVFKP